MATSGAIDTVSFDARKVIERAFRACRIDPQMITGEMVANAKDSLNLMLSSLPHSVTSAWTRDSVLVAIPMNTNAIPMPSGTQRVLSASYRTMQRLTGTVSASDGALTAANIIDGDYSTFCQQQNGGESLTVTLTAVSTVTCVGVALTADTTGTINVLTSADGTNFTVREVLTGGFKAYTFAWIDFDPTIDTQYVRIQGTNSLLLSVSEFFIGSTYSEIPLQAVSNDQYTNLTFQSSRSTRPVMFYQQRTSDGPVLNIWPQVSSAGTFGLLSVVRDRAPQDIIDMTNALEVPRIWNEAIIMGLAYRIALDEPKIDVSIVQMLKPMAEEFRRAALLADGDNTGWQMSWDLRGYQ